MVVQLAGGNAGFGGDIANGHGAKPALHNNFPTRIAI
ncbi:Uncharacterised protein [Klebsiella pneumoniae]|nr:Uncharacterised protein [Klebsiella pneumoniae]